MFLAQTFRRNLWRHKAKNALAVAIGALIVLLLNLYAGNIRAGQQQIAALAKTFAIRAELTNPNGSQITALKIDDETIRFLEASPYVKDLLYTVVLAGGAGTFLPEDWQDNLTIDFNAVNDLAAIPNLTADVIAFSKGMDAGILTGDQPLCLVYEEFARHYGLAVGDTMRFTLYYIQYPLSAAGVVQLNPLGIFDLTVAGVIWPTVWDSGAITTSVILPVSWVRAAYAQQGVAFSPTSASFTVADTLELNAFKAEMQAYGLMETDPTAGSSYLGNVLKVHDRIFLNAVNLLEESQRQLRFFIPYILVILVFTGYLAAYLLLHSRRHEFAVMRSLGTSKKTSFSLLVLENAALALCGALSGSLLAALLIPSADAAVLLLAGGAFIVCYLLGTAIALYGFGRFSVMDILTKTD